LTRELARHVESVTAVDASAAMIERARSEIDTEAVRFVQADLFEWTPDRTYDAVCFANWLSHVPPNLFDDFWTLVARCLRPHGRVWFLDEDERAVANDDRLMVSDVPAARRTLSDGRVYRVVKVFWHPDELTAGLQALGWSVQMRRLGDTFMYGVAKRDGAAGA
jgi:demethylmenaquinone methyltransferase/2-methoxy-6-polyprenyl-1,4-benzoquinol methylase